MSQQFEVQFVRSIAEIPKQQWNRVVNTDYPFIQYEFLEALELSGATTGDTGWQPFHLTLVRDAELVALMPLYLKNHSYGEYVFDFQWANAYHQSGLEYYPKLVSSIPFTPVSGQRIYFDSSINQETLYPIILKALKQLCTTNQVQSWHLLFPQQEESHRLKALSVCQRTGVQYHWMNKQYLNFDEFLGRCNKKHRNNMKRERRRVLQQNVEVELYEGPQITDEMWRSFYYFYQLTYAKRSGHDGYLNQAFFETIGKVMPEKIVMSVARFQNEMVAASLFFRDKQSLYGRYWGCRAEFDCLHFELCYYQGIDYCINHRLSLFDAGAQGEHKIQRGFQPVKTYSNHFISHPLFSDAIKKFTSEELTHVNELIEQLTERLPYKST
ncbi:GNAT family N-acetyltransferase [Aliikangiella coralliicola]|uniref:N-acetyltransferase n=1 Tax=Aliikangiella coralliicola TaxID=2592383 RepID=A0A545UDK3_9GAMM|nr:GNAT family N-acetyltransferase [Aliikangiella coralliicola]TQV87538.1 N-acetyltransferase [Aliikangiella coralliicola]